MITATPQRTADASRSIQPLRPDLVCVPLSIVNVYFVGPPAAADRQWVLVDAGLMTSGRRIRDEAAHRFGPDSRPAAIVLTHGHFDHVGAVRDLAQRWDVPIYAHPLELPYLTGRSSYPPPDPLVGGGGMALLSFLYPRGPIDLGHRVHPLPNDGTVPGMPGWRWIHTPGHTAGHVSFFRQDDRTLIVGDAFVTTYQESIWAVLRQPQHVWRPPAYFTPDWQASRQSIRELAQLDPDLAATGHGKPMNGPLLHAQLQALAQQFDRIAMPASGRYVRQPAQADHRGVTYVPPARISQRTLVLAGAALAVGVGLGLLLGGRR